MIKVYPQYLYSGDELGDLVEENGPHWATVLRTSNEYIRSNYKVLVLSKKQGYDPVRKTVFDLDPNSWLQRLHKDAKVFGMTAFEASVQAYTTGD